MGDSAIKALAGFLKLGVVEVSLFATTLNERTLN